jgi:hypothetical protein
MIEKSQVRIIPRGLDISFCHPTFSFMHRKQFYIYPFSCSIPTLLFSKQKIKIGGAVITAWVISGIFLLIAISDL